MHRWRDFAWRLLKNGAGIIAENFQEVSWVGPLPEEGERSIYTSTVKKLARREKMVLADLWLEGVFSAKSESK